MSNNYVTDLKNNFVMLPALAMELSGNAQKIYMLMKQHNGKVLSDGTTWIDRMDYYKNEFLKTAKATAHGFMMGVRELRKKGWLLMVRYIKGSYNYHYALMAEPNTQFGGVITVDNEGEITQIGDGQSAVSIYKGDFKKGELSLPKALKQIIIEKINGFTSKAKHVVKNIISKGRKNISFSNSTKKEMYFYGSQDKLTVEQRKAVLREFEKNSEADRILYRENDVLSKKIVRYVQSFATTSETFTVKNYRLNDGNQTVISKAEALDKFRHTTYSDIKTTAHNFAQYSFDNEVKNEKSVILAMLYNTLYEKRGSFSKEDSSDDCSIEEILGMIE